MKKLVLTLVLIAMSSVVYGAGYEKMDTLLNASKAKQIEIASQNGDYRIVVEDVDGTGERFCYEEISGMQSQWHKNHSVIVESSSVTDVLILASSSATETAISVSYVEKSGRQRKFRHSTQSSALNRSIGYYRGKENFLDMGVTLSRKGDMRWSVFSSGLGIGWVTPVSSDMKMNISMGKSVELTWANVVGVKVSGNRHHASLGIGIDWRNLVTHGNAYFEKDEFGKIIMLPYDNNASDKRSRIKIFSLQMPLLYGFDFGKKRQWGLTIGPVLNFNTSASLKTSWIEGDREYSVKTRHIGQRPVTVDVMGAINYRHIGIYARYAPMNMFKDNAGIKFGCFSTGLMLFF